MKLYKDTFLKLKFEELNNEVFIRRYKYIKGTDNFFKFLILTVFTIYLF